LNLLIARLDPDLARSSRRGQILNLLMGRRVAKRVEDRPLRATRAISRSDPLPYVLVRQQLARPMRYFKI
jgi:hypothetical protein